MRAEEDPNRTVDGWPDQIATVPRNKLTGNQDLDLIYSQPQSIQQRAERNSCIWTSQLIKARWEYSLVKEEIDPIRMDLRFPRRFQLEAGGERRQRGSNRLKRAAPSRRRRVPVWWGWSRKGGAGRGRRRCRAQVGLFKMLEWAQRASRSWRMDFF